MITIPVLQGSSEWLAARQGCFTASEAAAALGKHRYMSRGDLLKQKHSGVSQDVDSFKQGLFDKGHAAEAAARPLAEILIGMDLYPTTAKLEIEGLQLLASFDGISMCEEIIFEHKLWNDDLASDVERGTLDPHYTIQMDQQLLISGAKKCLFMVSDGTENRMVSMWYEPNQDCFDVVIAGWKQFAADLAEYVPTEIIPPTMAAPVIALPAVSVQVSGEIAIIDNFKLFEVALRDFVDNRLIRKPQNDQDFADLGEQIKSLKKAEEALDAAETSMLSQVESVDAMKRTKDLLYKLARDNRLVAEKLLASEKENRRNEIVLDGKSAVIQHIDALNARLGKPYMPVITADFFGVIKGMKSLDSMKDKIATELARFKIETNTIADRIQINLNTLRELAADHTFLFADTAQIVLKANDDLTSLVKLRIAEHTAAEEKRLVAERARIAEEERIKAEAKVQAEQAVQIARDKAALDARAAAEAKPAPAAQEITQPVATAPAAQKQLLNPAAAWPMPTRQPAALTPPSLRLGQIGERLGFSLTADFLKSLGFEPAGRDKAAVLFHDADFGSICAALVKHIDHVQAQQAA